MKKILLLQCFFLAAMWAAVAQEVPFKILYQGTIKGDMIVVGNTIINEGDYPANTIER